MPYHSNITRKRKYKFMNGTMANTNTVTVNTHAYIQQVSNSRGLKLSNKLILIHLLEKYQARDKQGNPFTFSNDGITSALGIGKRTVETFTAELRKKSILKVCGYMRYHPEQDRPTTLHYFNLTALKPYLEVNANNEKCIVLNVDAGETPIDTTKNNAVNAEVNARSKRNRLRYSKKIIKEDSTKNKVLVLSTVNCNSKPIDATTNKNNSGNIVGGNTSILVSPAPALLAGERLLHDKNNKNNGSGLGVGGNTSILASPDLHGDTSILALPASLVNTSINNDSGSCDGSGINTQIVKPQELLNNGSGVALVATSILVSPAGSSINTQTPQANKQFIED